MNSSDRRGFIPSHGYYKNLLSYQKAEVVYDLTFARNLGYKKPITYENYRKFCETRSAEVVANIALCLIHQTNYLLDQQIKRLEQDFIREGGLRERMTRARLNYRKNNK